MIIVHLGTLSALHACGLLTNVGAITINGRGNLLENLKGKMFVGHRRYWFRCVRKKKREAFLREYKSGSAMRSDWYFSLDRFINFDWVFRSLTYIATCFITVETRALFINIWNISKKFIFLFLHFVTILPDAKLLMWLKMAKVTTLCVKYSCQNTFAAGWW